MTNRLLRLVAVVVCLGISVVAASAGNATQVASGAGWHTRALTSDLGAVCWARNQWGQLGGWDATNQRVDAGASARAGDRRGSDCRRVHTNMVLSRRWETSCVGGRTISAC